MRYLLLILAVLLFAMPVSSGTARKGGGGSISIVNVAYDLDGDGNPDHILCADFDGDATLSDLDIDACQDLLTDTGPAVLELVAGDWDIDLDGDGVGETGCANTDNPHVCLRSQLTFKGQGVGITDLLATPTAGGYGSSPLIALDQDGGTFAQSSSRHSNVHIHGLSVGTGNSATQTSFAGVMGIKVWDCDECSVHDVYVHDTQHAAVHFTRNTDTHGYRIRADRSGNYDYSPGGAPDPTVAQPCLYLYSSESFEQTNTGFSDSKCDGVNGTALNWRTAGWIERPEPLGESYVNFNATQNRVAQVFTFDQGDNRDMAAHALVFWCARVPNTSPAGSIEVSIQTTSAGAPTGTAVTGYDFADFDSYEADLLGTEAEPIIFRRTSGSPDDLITVASNTVYAAVLRYTTDNDTVRCQLDDGGATDTYTGGEVYYGTADDFSTGPGVQTNYDLNFAVATALLTDNYYERIIVENVTGTNEGGNLCSAMANALRPRMIEVECYDTQGINIGANPTLVKNPVFRGVRSELIETSNNVPAIQIGTHCHGCEVVDAYTDSRKAGDFALGISLQSFSRNVVVRGAHIVGANTGVVIPGGNRNISVLDSFIESPISNGIAVSSVSDDDGVLGRTETVHIAGNTIRGGVYGILRGSTGSVVDGLSIEGNTFTNQGINCILLTMQNTASERLTGVSMQGNLFRDWARASGNGCIEISGSVKGLSATGNVFSMVTTGKRAFSLNSSQNGNDWIISGNDFRDDYGANEAIFWTTDDAIDDSVEIHSNTGETEYKAPTGLKAAGDPNSSYTAWPGRMFMRTDPSAGTSPLYVGTCADAFDTGGPPQTSGSPDGNCDSDGTSAAWVN